MRTGWILGLATIGVLTFAQPCAAQMDGVRLAGNSSAYSKTATPQRLAPPEAMVPEAMAPEPAPKRRAKPQPVAPQNFYDRPSFKRPASRGAGRTAPITNVKTTPGPAVAIPAPNVSVPSASTPSVSVPDVPTARVAAPAPTAPVPSSTAARAPSAPYGGPSIAAPNQEPFGARAAPPSPYGQPPEFGSAKGLLDWISNYRDNPQYWKVPAAVHGMRDHGLFTDEEQRWFCIGFIAGVLGTNPNDGPGLIPKMFPMPAKEQEVIIRAIAYSGRPDWQDLLTKNAAKMPLRKPLIDDFLNGRRPTLQKLELDLGGPPEVYALWGYYVATGQHEPVIRIMQALKWSKGAKEQGFFGKLASGWGADANNLEKVTTGGTAKWTLASYAERDRELIGLYRAEVPNQPEEIAKPLNDVIKAADLFEAEKIRKEQYGAIEDAQREQLTATAGPSKGFTAGSIAIATGCMAASALGQAYIAVPCVIGGALYSGAGKLAR